MPQRRSTPAIGSAVVLGLQLAVCPLAHASPQTDCGTVTYPRTGHTGTVHIAAGDISCADATAVIRRYFNDPTLTREGNTESAQFDGWGCANPTATAAALEGYSTRCDRGGVQIQVRSTGS